MSPHCRQVLDGFHSRKKERGVDETLVRLYEPILWRAMKVCLSVSCCSVVMQCQVPNGMVRANAAALMIDAFPLQDPAHSLAQAEE
jgi:condensin-2 complex subunit G2